MKYEVECNSSSPLWIPSCFDLSEGRSYTKPPNFPISRLKKPPKDDETFEFAVENLSAARRPCRASGCSKVWTPVAQILAYILTQRRDYMHTIFVTTIFTTSFPKKLENSANEKTTVSCTLPDRPSPPPLLLMSFIERTSIHVQTKLKPLTWMYGIYAYWNVIIWACFRQYKVNT